MRFLKTSGESEEKQGEDRDEQESSEHQKGKESEDPESDFEEEQLQGKESEDPESDSDKDQLQGKQSEGPERSHEDESNSSERLEVTESGRDNATPGPSTKAEIGRKVPEAQPVQPFSEIATPPSDFKGDTNMVSFWESVTMEMIGWGFLSSGRKNPFIVCPSYDCWAPWIGPNTRKSDIVLNTEHAKLQKTKSCDVPDLDVTEERLGDELFNLKVDAVRKLCKECGLDTKGSRMDLVLRLRPEMQNHSAYDKIFQQIWGASEYLHSNYILGRGKSMDLMIST
ncbi:hypothetical protein DPX16_0834 [Anabarilius grahami]|uniref:SAP domain-containing protein n=1 Tax=Anabarilius grahami TaxID=495550 RepID=A0A3N0XLS9_ANAGA|nr:hypothetical protein DPX16_0834 [Anabarilius grahami]